MPDPSLLGTWKMVSWTRKVLATGEVSDAMGPDPTGYIAYHADGRMMALVLKSDRPPFTGPVPTDEEKIRLFDTMLAYSATYTLARGLHVHRLGVAQQHPVQRGPLVDDLLQVVGGHAQ